jgi:hypothetical protein
MRKPISTASLRFLVASLLTLVCSSSFAGAQATKPKSPVSFSTGSGGESLDLVPYLLDMDFVVIASLSRDYDGTSSYLPVTVSDVVLGSLPNEHLVLYVPTFARDPLAAGARLLAWGSWVHSRGDTCNGNALTISSDGSLRGYVGTNGILVGDTSAVMPSSLERATRRLKARADENHAAWLAQGASVGLFQITAINYPKHVVTVAPLAVLYGTKTTSRPSRARWHPTTHCGFMCAAGDSLILALPASPPDTLELSACMQRLHLWGDGEYISPLGVRLADLPAALSKRTSSGALKPIHGVAEP